MKPKPIIKSLLGGICIALSIVFNGIPLFAQVRSQVGEANSGRAADMISCGVTHSLIIDKGKVYAAGNNFEGQLGNGTTYSSEVPVEVQGLDHVIAVRAGFRFSIALKSDGTVWAWGGNSFGQLGNGTFDSSTVPVQVKGLANVISISTASVHCLALKANGTVWAWGANHYGQLGDGTTSETGKNIPVQTKGVDGIGWLTNITAIAAGGGASLALKSDGSVLGWGDNGKGELGNGTLITKNTPAQIPGISNVIAIDMGYENGLVLQANGTVWSWGENLFGQLGNGISGPGTGKNIPVQVKNSNGNSVLSNITSIKIGGLYSLGNDGFAHRTHILALAADGTVWAWGANDYGQLGNGTSSETGKNLPVRVKSFNGMDFLDNISAITAGRGSSFAIKSNGTIWAWGENSNGQFGIGQSSDKNPLPIQINQLSPGSLSIAAGANHCLDLKTNGKVYSWGRNNNGQLGDGTIGVNKNTPITVQYLGGFYKVTDMKSVAGGGTHSLALRSDGRVYSWGNNNVGQLGNGNNNTSLGAVKVKGSNGQDSLTNIVTIAAAVGGDHNLALRSDGTVWSWGLNSKGQLGNGNNTDQNIPVQIDDFIDVAAIAAGRSHSLALKANGSVWAWGLNYAGQLGNGTSGIGTDKNTPVQVSGLSNVIAIAAGGQHSLALKADGSVWAWGNSMMGELGNGANIDSNVPVQVIVGYLFGQKINLLSVKAIAAGASAASQSAFNYNPEGFGSNSIALTAGGYVFTWGENYKGQLGIGTTGGYKNVATPAQNVSGIKSINNLGYHSIICKDDGSVLTVGGNSYGQLGNGTFSSGSNLYSSP